MSVYGGDSWGREAQYRKRRVDDLIVDGIDASLSASSYKKLSTGKFACLVCPHNPILDTPLMLSMHIKGSRHRAAESRVTERELARQDEMNKRIALSDYSTCTTKTSTPTQRCRSYSKPLIEQTRKAASEILCNKTCPQSSTNGKHDVKYNSGLSASGPLSSNTKDSFLATEVAGKAVVQQQSDFRDRRERELKFTAAGWKRDCHGRWFRDENVEFDSDEEDPNVCLA
ncbi:uncharacterized protein LOC132294051 [Cornus florida]|uniref:uncharacterized protein LOC132294051 n=1 Tax=Cornus florida TaxID=4283 RepID=UPI0028A16D4F|nr:uncharacterized protein LOC132294051 [Cornus florida]